MNADDLTSNQQAFYLFNWQSNLINKRIMAAGTDASNTCSYLETYAYTNILGIYHIELLTILINASGGNSARYLLTPSSIGGIGANSIFMDAVNGGRRVVCAHNNTELTSQGCTSAYVFI